MSGERTNWAGNITFAAGRVHRPSSVPDLQHIVARAGQARALGSGHSFNRLADTPGDLISVAGLPPVIETDSASGSARVSAGLRYGEIATALNQAGRALHNLGSLPHISVAGACATGTHGSGDHNGNLATAVSALDMVTAGGDLVTVTRDRDPGRFPGMVVALGALGIVTAMTLDTVPAFEVRQYVYEDLAADAVREHFDEIMGSAYSVSLFTDWRRPGIRQAWLKRRDGAGDGWTPQEHWMGGRLADGPRHPVPGMPAAHSTVQQGVPGPWHERLPHFRLEFTPSSGDELQSEYLLARGHAIDGLDVLASVADVVAPVLQVGEIRTVAADELWLSPATGRDTVAFHFTWVKDWPAVAPVLQRLEAGLAPLLARPHWGKLSRMRPADVTGLYDQSGPFAGLMREYDPAGKFRNDLMNGFFPPDR